MTSIARESQGLRAVAPWLALLIILMMINYVDRGNLSIAAPLLKDELHIDAWQLGLLFSAFFWTYTALQFLMGWLVDRFDVNVVIAAGFMLWSLATIATGLVEGVALLVVMRLILGIGESVAFPSCSKIFALHLNEEHRGFANGAIQAGLQCGPAVGTFGAGTLMAKFGWRPVFVGIGLISLAWLPAWRRWMPRDNAVSTLAQSGHVSIAAILRQPRFWGACTGHFCGNYALYVMVTWLPFYLVRERHLSLSAMAKTAAVYFLVNAAASIATGYFSDSLIRRGHSPTIVRKSTMLIGHTTAAIALAACTLAGPRAYLAWLLIAGAGGAIGGSATFAFAQTLAGPRAAGRWTGFQNGFANLAGVIGPALTGFIVNRTGNFHIAFLIVSAVSLAGGLAWVLLTGPLQQVTWAPESRPLAGSVV